MMDGGASRQNSSVMPDVTYQLVAPYFVAGIVVRAGKVRRAAPIVSYMRGWSIERVLDYARRKGFVVNCVEEGE